MVLASLRPPVDPDENNNQTISFKLWVNTPGGTLLLKFDTLRALEQLRSKPNDTMYPQIFKMQYLHR